MFDQKSASDWGADDHRMNDPQLTVDVDGFEGPLDLLLELSRRQKVDLSKISILALAVQYLEFIEEARKMRIELAADYLVMAAWLAYLKSKLLLPADEDEEEEMPDDIANLPPEKQQRAIKMRAFTLMFFGTVLVLIFADPMVGALNKFGAITGIPAFFVAFILAPLASNASEILAAYSFGLKKTEKHITISFAQLQGAACMNNTFCLGIFLVLIFLKEELTWEYSAETLGILITEIIMVVISLKKTQPLLTSFIVFLLFPLSICLILLFENAIGWN